MTNGNLISALRNMVDDIENLGAAPMTVNVSVLRQAIAALTLPDAYVRAVDRELVTAEIGVANNDDSFEGASQKLHDLIIWHVQVATDPAVNGGFVLVPVEPTEEMAQATVYNGIDYTHAFDMEDFRRDYAAMLAARPEVK